MMLRQFSGGSGAAFLGLSYRRVSRDFERRSVTFCLSLVLCAVVVALLEVAVDPLTAWEHSLEAQFGLFIPVLAISATMASYRSLANPGAPHALAARHGADRRRSIAVALISTLGFAVAWTTLALVVSRVLSHPAPEPAFDRDLLRCCGIGCLATIAYIAFLLAATRLGGGRMGAWVALGLDLTLSHVDAAWSAGFPHRHVANLIGHPGVTFLSATASSWILLGFVVVGLAVAIGKTPR